VGGQKRIPKNTIIDRQTSRQVPFECESADKLEIEIIVLQIGRKIQCEV